MTMTLAASDVDRRQPWPGLASYGESDAALFFGREQETQELLRLVRRNTLTVVFGPSGMGKTSLLSAGIFPRLRDAGFLPIRIRLNHSSAGPDYPRQIRDAIDDALASDTRRLEQEALAPQQVDGSEETLWEFLHRVVFWDPRNNPIAPVLAFDQFEELFTLGRSGEAVQTVVTMLADLAENYIPSSVRARIDASGSTLPFPVDQANGKVILSLREDFVWRLDGLRNLMPSVMHNRFTVSRMNGEQAVLAVREPGRGLLTNAVAQEVVRFVAAANQSDARSGEEVPLGKLQVDPALLSVVCRELNTRRIEHEKNEISQDLLAQAGTDILNDFYEKAFAGLDPAIRVFVEDRLLTGSGFRSTVPREEATASGIASADIATLVDRRLIREEQRLGIPHLELSHDLLTKVVQASRVVRQEREALDREKQKREVELRERAVEEARRQRQLLEARRRVVFASLAAVICLALGLLAFVSYQRADAALGLARAAQELAEAERKKAVAEEAAARQARDDAAAAQGTAERALVTSKDNEARATAALGRAEASESRNRQLLYVSRLGLAYRASAQEDYGSARDVLSRYAPGVGSDDAGDRRSFPWFYLWRFTPAAPTRLPTANTTRGVVFSGDGGTVIARDAMGVVLWTRDAPQKPIRLNAGVNGIAALATSPDGRTLAVGGSDGLKLWTLDPRAEMPPLEGDRSDVRSLAFSPDGSMLAAGGGAVRLWDLRSRKPITLQGPKLETSNVDRGGGVAFAPISPALAVCTERQVKLFDLKTYGERIALDVGDELRQCYSVAYSRKGLVAASGTNLARVWDAQSGKPIATLEGHGNLVLSVAFSPDGNLLATGSSDNTIKLWDAIGLSNSRQPVPLTTLSSNDGYVYAIAFAPDGKTLAAANIAGAVNLWDLRRWQERYPLTGHTTPVNSLAFSPDSRRLVSGSTDNTARLWDPVSRNEVTMLAERFERLAAVAASPDGRTIALGGGNAVRFVDPSGKEIGTLQRSGAGPAFDAVKSVAFSRDGKLLAVADARGVTVWDAATRREQYPVPGELRGASLVTFLSGGSIVIAASDGISVWSTGSRQRSVVVPARLTTGATTFALSPDERLLAFPDGPPTHRIHIWGLQQRGPIGELQGHSDRVVSLAFSPDGKTLASGSYDRSLRLWDTSSWQEMVALPEASSIEALVFSPDGRMLAGSSNYSGIKLWYAAAEGEIPATKALSTSSQQERGVTILEAPPGFEPGMEVLQTRPGRLCC